MPKEVLKYAWVPTKVENKWIWLKPYWSLTVTEPFTKWVTLEVGRRNL